jgi:uncharacterized protein
VVQPGRPGASRPLAGPVIPLTASIGGGGNELLGGGPARPAGNDPIATRVLVRGEPVTAPIGRADNFAWPRSGTTTISEGEPDEAPTPPQQAATEPQSSTPRPASQPAPAPAATAPRPKAQQPQQQQAPWGDPRQATPQQQRRPPQQQPPRASNDWIPRPPLGLFGR